MTLTVYNTRTRAKEPFEPIDPAKVRMYVCGPTVYNFVHIGNARPVVVFDTLFRVLQQEYDEVIYARNITDIDDKIINTARENNESIGELAERYTLEYQKDMSALGNLQPSITPKATDHVVEMVNMIEALVASGHAYEADGQVLFDVKSMSDYGKLSNRSLEDMLDGARVEVASYKRYAGDFVLWKPSNDEEPGWDSPWGRGRPGWHIECSAMIEKHLGETIDIHGGGRDLIFPHHENELAQSQCAHGGKEYVRYWMHNGYINIGGEKMSKSLDNFHTVRDLLSKYRGEVIRYALLSAHYRSELDFSFDLLDQSKANLDYLYGVIRRSVAIPSVETTDEEFISTPFYQALLDDLNTPIALAQLRAIAKKLNGAADSEKPALKSLMLRAATFLGLLDSDPEEWFQTRDVDETSEALDIDALVSERTQAKLDGDYARADEIRKQLLEEGVVLEDSREGTTWRRA